MLVFQRVGIVVSWCWSSTMQGIHIWQPFFLSKDPVFHGVLTCILCVGSEIVYYTEQNSKEFFILALVVFCCDKHDDQKQLRKSNFQLASYSLSPREVRINSEHKNWNMNLKPKPERAAGYRLADRLRIALLASLYSSGPTAQRMVLPGVG